jgi:exonuclease SbcD
MKFLHLSDLHIGKSVNGFSMIAEQRHAFRQIIECIRAKRPAAVVIAGDVYDRAIPGVEAVRLFDDFLTELASEDTSVLLISGNHDSPERLSYAGRLLSKLSEKRLHLCGAFEGSPRKVVINDEYGEVNFWLLPFIKPSYLRGKAGELEIESYDDAIMAALQAADIDYASRNVLVSHQFYTKSGVSPIRSESELNPVGGLDAVNAELIERFDYTALGHLHGGQSIGSNCIRYCGSPIKYSFSEWRQEKSVTLVEMKEKGSLVISTLPLAPIHDMREIKGELIKLTSDEISSLEDKEDYLRVILTDKEEIIDPMGKLRSEYPNIMSLGFDNLRANIDIGSIMAGSEAIETLSVYELFGEFFLEVQGSVMSEEQTEIVRELLEGADEE